MLKYWVALLIFASRTVIYPCVSTWLAVSHGHFSLFKQKPCASCFLVLSRSVAARCRTRPETHRTVVAEPLAKLLVRPRIVGYFLLANPISHVYCDLGRSSWRSVITLTGICTKCQLVKEVSPAQVTESLTLRFAATVAEPLCFTACVILVSFRPVQGCFMLFNNV